MEGCGAAPFGAYAYARLRSRAYTANETTLHTPAVLNQPPTGVYSSRWCMEASMFQRSALWVQNNEALVAGGAMSLFSASLALGVLL